MADEIFDISSDEDDGVGEEDDDDIYEFYEIRSESGESTTNTPTFAGFQPVDDKSLIHKVEQMDVNESNVEQRIPSTHNEPSNPRIVIHSDIVMKPRILHTVANVVPSLPSTSLPFIVNRSREIEADTTSKSGRFFFTIVHFWHELFFGFDFF